MDISIICPLYNGKKYIRNLDKSLKMQKKVCLEAINYILTESEDDTEVILRELKAQYTKVSKREFSHSLTREKAAVQCRGDIIVFITQDVVIRDEYWLYNLTRDIISNKCEASFSRQVSADSGIEKYIRAKNYPEQSRIVSRKDIEKLGLMTFFFSDAASAVRADVFKQLNGYDGRNLIISEDMYLAYKIIMGGYRIKYCADSVVIHSHNFTLKQLYRRYYDTGVFFRENSYLQEYSENTSAVELTRYILKESIKNKDYKVILNIIPNFAARFIGMKAGKMYKRYEVKKYCDIE